VNTELRTSSAPKWGGAHAHIDHRRRRVTAGIQRTLGRSAPNAQRHYSAVAQPTAPAARPACARVGRVVARCPAAVPPHTRRHTLDRLLPSERPSLASHGQGHAIPPPSQPGAPSQSAAPHQANRRGRLLSIPHFRRTRFAHTNTYGEDAPAIPRLPMLQGRCYTAGLRGVTELAMFSRRACLSPPRP